MTVHFSQTSRPAKQKQWNKLIGALIIACATLSITAGNFAPSFAQSFTLKSYSDQVISAQNTPYQAVSDSLHPQLRPKTTKYSSEAYGLQSLEEDTLTKSSSTTAAKGLKPLIDLSSQAKQSTQPATTSSSVSSALPPTHLPTPSVSSVSSATATTPQQSNSIPLRPRTFQPKASSGFHLPSIKQMSQKLHITKVLPGDEITVFKPLKGILVLPVIRHGREKAFSDVAMLLANEFSDKLAAKYPDTEIYNPLHSIEKLRHSGLEGAYNRMMGGYIRARRPDAKRLSYLISELSRNGQPIERVVFLEADVDMQHLNRSRNLKDIFMKAYADKLPKEQRYHVNSRVQIFNTSNPHHPILWSFSWNYPIKTTGIASVTPSVYQQGSTIGKFGHASRMLSRIILKASPPEAYQSGSIEIKTGVQGQIAHP